MALTRRVAAETALSFDERDPTLLRHVYDLHVIKDHCDLANVATMARDIMNHDAEEFGNQAYRTDCLSETRRALNELSTDASYSTRYTQFSRDMVFGKSVDYDVALQTLSHLAHKVPR